MNRPTAYDELACFGCHGVVGRVRQWNWPARRATDDRRQGFVERLPALLERVNESEVENSNCCASRLNVQTGKEDGHQGGVRYKPD